MSDDTSQMAPGLIKAFAPQEEEQNEGGRRRRRTSADEAVAALRSWSPKTRLGREVMAGRIVTYEQALASGLPSIVSSVGVIPDYLTDNIHAKIIPPKNTLALESAIISLNDNLELRNKLSKNGFLLAKTLFLSKTSLKKLSSIIDGQIH